MSHARHRLKPRTQCFHLSIPPSNPCSQVRQEFARLRARQAELLGVNAPRIRKTSDPLNQLSAAEATGAGGAQVRLVGDPAQGLQSPQHNKAWIPAGNKTWEAVQSHGVQSLRQYICDFLGSEPLCVQGVRSSRNTTERELQPPVGPPMHLACEEPPGSTLALAAAPWRTGHCEGAASALPQAALAPGPGDAKQEARAEGPPQAVCQYQGAGLDAERPAIQGGRQASWAVQGRQASHGRGASLSRVTSPLAAGPAHVNVKHVGARSRL